MRSRWSSNALRPNVITISVVFVCMSEKGVRDGYQIRPSGSGTISWN